MRPRNWDRVQRFSELMLLNGGALRPAQRMLFAGAAIGLAFLIRYLLDPLFGPDRFVFSSFYMAVVAIAFVAGVMPAIIASLIVAPLAYWAFAEPAFAWKSNNAALAAIYFYTLTTLMNILFIWLLQKVMAENQKRRAEAESQAEGHAALFREFNLRSAHHLQLVAALLDALASEDRGGRYAQVVADTSSKTLAIARLHRTLDGEGKSETDITAFARHMLLASIDTASGNAPAVQVTGDSLILPAEQATSTAVILLEYMRALLERAPVRIDLTIDTEKRTMLLTATDVGGKAMPVRLDERFARDVVAAALQQLSGSLVDSDTRGMSGLRLALPFGTGAPLPPEFAGWASQTAGDQAN